MSSPMSRSRQAHQPSAMPTYVCSEGRMQWCGNRDTALFALHVPAIQVG